MTTINDVAKQAGVSPVTVSRVINNAGNVSASTKARVEQAIADLGYVPSGAAQSLRSKRTKTLALIVPDIQNAFWTTVARGIEDAAQSRGYSIFLCNTDENGAKQRHNLDAVISRRVDGVIIAPTDSDAKSLEPLRRRNLPTVVVDRHINGWDVDTVSSDSISASRTLVQHLINLGHKRIAVISGPMKASTASDRIYGYRVALAEAGIPYDPALAKSGEYRSISGERLTHQLLQNENRPTAIFAANNVIAVGVIDALDAHNLRIPQDMALVCIDDLPNTSRLFPFLTVVVQPAYDIGANAAQLILSRLDSDTPLAPRHVALPTRLIVRHSCGSALADPNRETLSLPLRREAHERIELVKPLTSDELNLVTAQMDDGARFLSRYKSELAAYEKPDVNRLYAALRFEMPDRAPHVEFDIRSQRLYEFVLSRKLKQSGAQNGGRGPAISPQEHIEFAQRMGLDAILCDFSDHSHGQRGSRADDICQYGDGTVKTWVDLDQLEQPIAIADQLDNLERYLRAADGAQIGVFANFTSFFDCAIRVAGFNDSHDLLDNRFFFERLMDILLERQERVMRSVCDRFAGELSFVVVRDEIADMANSHIPPNILQELYPERMRRLITPAKEYGLPVAIHTQGDIEQHLALLYDIGFDIIHPASSAANTLRAYKEAWQGKLVFAGGFPVAALRQNNPEEIAQQVKTICAQLSPTGGYLFGVSGAIDENIPPENFVAMTQALHQYGRYLRANHASKPTRTHTP